MSDASPPPADGVPVCYRHPDRETYIRCSRCDRPICPECMIPASVGFQCPDDVRQGSAGTRSARTVFGGRVSQDQGYVTKALIAINVVCFVLQQLSPTFESRLLEFGLAGDPRLGAGWHGIAAGESYRLVTAAFLHGSIFHLLFNMWALWVFGPVLEGILGRSRFIALYLLSTIGGATASYAFSASNQASLGASGAIFGLFAAYMIAARRLGRDLQGMVVLLILNVVIGFISPNIDWRAHFGGFVTGGLVAVAFAYAPRARRNIVQVGACVVIAAVILGWAAVRTADLTNSGVGSVAACSVTATVDPGESFLDCVTS